MCGRYGLFMPADEIAALFGADSDFQWDARFNVAPSQIAPVAIGSDSEPRVGPMRWGFHVDARKKGRRLINARSETAHVGPAFRTAFARRRCLVPANGFYEWRMEDGGKTPYWVHSVTTDPLVMAGVWGRDPAVEGVGAKGRQTGEAGFAILTRAATGTATDLHPRMPALLKPEDWNLWLDRETPLAALRAALAKRVPALSAYPVSPLVNRPANDTADCIAPTGALLF